MTKPVDPLKEANVYLAYGRDAQAAEILRSAIADDPTREDLKLKLAEIVSMQQTAVSITSRQQIIVGVLLIVAAALKFVAAEPSLQMAGLVIGFCAVLYLCVCLVRKPSAGPSD